MDTTDISAHRSKTICMLLMLASAALAVFGAWAIFAPPSDRQLTIKVKGPHARLGDCVAKALRDDPRIGDKMGQDISRTSVTLLSDPETKTTRVLYEGHMRLNFTVTLTGGDTGMTEARMIAFPHFDPAPAIEDALANCGRGPSLHLRHTDHRRVVRRPDAP